MREILYRGKRTDNKKWIEGYYAVVGEKKVIIAHPEMFYDENAKQCYGSEIKNIEPETVCQYIGLTDKNGRKIFEGDIVRGGGMLVVTWNEKFAGWCLTKEGWLYNHFFGEACEPGDCEVIGNIFDNPELIKFS